MPAIGKFVESHQEPTDFQISKPAMCINESLEMDLLAAHRRRRTCPMRFLFTTLTSAPPQVNLIVEQLKQGLKDRENKAKTGKVKGLCKR